MQETLAPSYTSSERIDEAVPCPEALKARRAYNTGHTALDHAGHFLSTSSTQRRTRCTDAQVAAVTPVAKINPEGLRRSKTRRCEDKT